MNHGEWYVSQVRTDDDGSSAMKLDGRERGARGALEPWASRVARLLGASRASVLLSRSPTAPCCASFGPRSRWHLAIVVHPASFHPVMTDDVHSIVGTNTWTRLLGRSPSFPVPLTMKHDHDAHVERGGQGPAWLVSIKPRPMLFETRTCPLLAATCDEKRAFVSFVLGGGGGGGRLRTVASWG